MKFARGKIYEHFCRLLSKNTGKSLMDINIGCNIVISKEMDGEAVISDMTLLIPDKGIINLYPPYPKLAPGRGTIKFDEIYLKIEQTFQHPAHRSEEPPGDQ